MRAIPELVLRLSGTVAVLGALGSAGCAVEASEAISEFELPQQSEACAFRDVPDAGMSRTKEFFVKLPHGVPSESIALGSAGGKVAVRPKSRVLAEQSGFAAVSSVENPERSLVGESAEVGNVYSEPEGVKLDHGAHVHGFIKTAGSVQRHQASIVDGEILEGVSLRPLDTAAWAVGFPAHDRGSCDFSQKTLSLDPGSYGEIAVGTNARLVLRPGRYYFRTLKVAAKAVLDAGDKDGSISIYVEHSFDFGGEVTTNWPDGSRLFVGVAGNQVSIKGAFRGALVAPWADLKLDSAKKAELRGSFFARSIDLQPHTTLRHTPFSSVTQCEPEPALCTTLCRCSAGGACRTDAECRQGLVCVGKSQEGPGTCQPADVDDGNPCTIDELDPANGPVHRPHPPGTSCSDGNACDGEETCDGAGACVEGAPPDLDDHNACTIDACTTQDGITHLPVTAGLPCGDDDLCNGDERCDGAGSCSPGTAPVLDDGNPCTADACDPAGGVRHTPLPGASCADSNVCNGAETCDEAGSCRPGTPLPVDDSNLCTTDRCDPTTGVHHDPVTSGTSCADADRCNGDERCDGTGQCVGGGQPSADDGNPCTIDACDPSSGESHTPRPSGTPCDNANVCDGVSVCNASGTCIPGTPLVVDDQNPCTIDSCDPLLGVRHEPVLPGTSCDDGNPCNGVAYCSAAGSCEPGEPPILDDGNPCTTDGCGPSGVFHEPAPIGTGCADDDLCNGGETCDGAGSCGEGSPLPVDDANPCTTDSCHPTLGVQHDPLGEGASCSDGDACNGNELCDSNAACQPGQAPEIDDGNTCTLDRCDPATGVIHESAPAGTSCSEGDVCSGPRTCDGAGVCTPGEGLELLAIQSPVTGFLTREATVVVSGTSRASAEVVVSVEPGGASVTLRGGGAPEPFSLPVPLVEGENRLEVRALDANACAASEEIVVTRDATPPSITLTAPESLSSRSVGQAVVTATDAQGVVEVRFALSFEGTVISQQARSTPPYVFELVVPSAAAAGSTLVLEAFAVDQAGNEAQASVTAVVTTDAMVIGRVLSDATGQPLGNSLVRFGGQTVTVRPDGRYALTASGSDALVRAWRPGFTDAERRASIEPGTGSVAFDARLTPLAEPVLVSGDDLTLGAVLARWDGQPVEASLAVPAAAFEGPVALHFTALSPQGLPALLPHGWSPVAAFELRLAPPNPDEPMADPDAAFPALEEPLALTLRGLPSVPLGFVLHDRTAHAWRSLGALGATAGEAASSLTALGAYAVVVADSGATTAVPAPGVVLGGVQPVPLPVGITAQAAGVPNSLPAGGGVAQGRVVVPSAISLPSGTVITAAVHEAYGLVAGGTASTETALQNLVLYRAQVPAFPGLDPTLTSLLGATFPLAPTMTFGASELGTGKIHVDVKAGREAHRGKIGGRAPVTVEHAGAALTLGPDSLEGDTVIDVERIDIPDFAFRSAELVPLGAVYIDLTGALLNHGAELALSGLPLAGEETPLLARLERVDSVARPFVVALGTYDGAEWTFSDGDGLAGLVKEGTYVIYRATVPLGFVAGTTTAAGAPVQALVSTGALPFIAPSSQDGSYKIPARPGNAVISARVPGTNLVAGDTALVTDGHTTSFDLALEGEAAEASVTPTDGSVAVPRTTQIELTTPIALDLETVTEDNIKLFAGDPLDNVLVSVRLQLSASGRSLAVIPEVRLEAGADHTLQASGLRDTLGGLVVVPVTTFRTAVEVPPTLDPGAIAVSIPGDGGNARVTSPPGTLRPGTTVIITNEGNGHVTSCSVGNDGALDCEIPASIDDTLVVSVTDPDGSTTTRRHGQYQLADGRTAVGPAGGVVTGPGGVQLRIPEGALTSGVVFKLEPVDVSVLPDRPYVPGLEFGTALKLETQGNPIFQKEVDLAFPRPADAPDGSFYYVYRRLEPTEHHPLPQGAAYEVIDHAFPEGPNRIVTASCPFPGVTEAIGFAGEAYRAYFAAPSSRAIGAVTVNAATFLLTYTYNALNAGTPTVGIIRGRVVRPKFELGASEPTFEGLQGATVTGFDASGNPFVSDPNTSTPPPGGQPAPIVATTQPDGTFTLWDPFPTEGIVKIRAALEGTSVFQPCPATPGPDDKIRCVTGVQEVVETCANAVRFYRNQVKANVTFPPDNSTPPSPTEFDIRVLREVDSQRQATDGIVLVGSPLIVGFSALNADVRTAEITQGGQTQSLSIRTDPLAGLPGGMDRIADFTPTAPGTYSISAIALPLPSGSPISASYTFRAVASGGDISQPVLGAEPRVVTARTLPRKDEVEVPTTIFPHVVFTEPVKHLPGHVVLEEPSGTDVPTTLVGVAPDGTPVVLTGTHASDAVTAVTVQPTSRLKFGTTHTLRLTGDIKDLDDQGTTASALSLVPFEIEFTTVRAEALTDPGSGFSSGGIAAVGQFAFLVENRFQQGILRVFDVSAPANPVEVPEGQKSMAGRPMDIAARPDGDGALVAVVTGPTDVSLPSNLRLYRIGSSGASEWIGASSLTATASQGIVQRVALHDQFAYATTTQRGIQVVDLQSAQTLFETAGGDTSRVRVPLNTDAQGFGHEAVVATIPVLRENDRHAFLSDLDVLDLVDGFSQPIVITTGDLGLATVNPMSSEVLFPTYASGAPVWERPGFIGRALATLRRDNGAYAVVAGEDGRGGPPTLLIVEVTNPRSPRIKGDAPLPQRPVDVVIMDGLALVGGQAPDLADSTVAIVNIDDLEDPFVAGDVGAGGEIPNIGGRLAPGQGGFFFGSMPSTSGGEVPLGGIRTATLGSSNASALRIVLEGGRTSIGTGEKARALAHTRPEKKPVFWSLSVDSPDVGVKASIDRETGFISVDENSKDGYATIEATFRDDPQVRAEAKVKIGCDCEKCETPGFCEPKVSSIDAVWSLGKGARGDGAGNLFLRSTSPTADLYTPRGLVFSSLDLAVEPVYGADGALRQALAPQTLTDVVVLGPQSFELRFYDASARGERQPEGHYEIAGGAVADVVWRVENPSASGATRLRLTETRSGQTKQHEYEWDGSLSQWILRSGNGDAVETRSETVSGSDRIVRVVTKDALGAIASTTELTYRQFAWGEELVREVLDPGGAALTTITDYWDAPGEPWRYQKVRSVQRPDGSWVRYEYRGGASPAEPGYGQVETEIGSWLDAPFGAGPSQARVTRYGFAPVDSRDTLVGLSDPERLQHRVAIEEIQGIEVARTYFAYVRDGVLGPRETVEERCVRRGCAYGEAGNLRTVSKYNALGAGLPSDGRLASIQHPDGRLDTYSYQYETYDRPANLGGGFGTATRQIVVHGTRTSPTGVAGKTTREISLTDERGQAIRDERFVFTGSGYALLDWTQRSYDGRGRLLQTLRSNGALETATWGCCSEESTTDSRGITTTVVARDGLERPLVTQRAGVTTTTRYDGAGRAISTTRSGGGLSLMTQQSYDVAGRLEESANEQGLVTRHTYAQGGRITTVIRPGGFTEVTERFADGQTKSITGTAVVAQYFTYSVNADGTRISETRLGSPGSPVFERSVSDAAGRVIRAERPGFQGSLETTENTYDSAGRLARVRATGAADTLNEYDAAGELARTGLDLNGNGTLDSSSDDRISDTTTSIQLIDGVWWQSSEQSVYPTNGSGTAVATGATLRRLTGLGGGLVSEDVSRDIHGNTTRSILRIDRAARTETNRIDVPESTHDAVSVSVEGRMVSKTTPTGITTTFDYDGLGRQTGTTDPRTGRTETLYDGTTGRVTGVRDPEERTTTFGYDPATGRKTSECNPLGKCSYFDYSARGELIRTWGQAPYPVEQVYDQYGRRTEMRTFRSGGDSWSSSSWPGGAASAGDVTRWDHEEATGLLLAKRDAVGQAVRYTYESGGRLKTRTWARRASGGQPLTTTYGYSQSTGELRSVDYSDETPDVAYTYDRLGRQRTISDGVGLRTFAYDPEALDLETETITGATPAVITRLHESGGVAGRPAGFELGPDYRVTYGYDASGRFATLGWNVTGVQNSLTYAYTPNSELLSGYTTQNGQQVSYAYEPKRNLKTQVQNRFAGNLVSQYDYTNDAAGRRTSVRNSGSAFAAPAYTRWTYDDRNQLTESRRFLGTNLTNESQPVTAENRSYAYDPIGNRISATTGGSSAEYSTNSLNQYTDASGASFAYDQDGNLSTSGGKEYTYNAENQLTAVSPLAPGSGDRRVRFAYDYMGRRVRKAVELYSGGWEIEYEFKWAYDGWNTVREIRTEGTAVRTKHFVWGLDLSRTLQGAGGTGGLIAAFDLDEALLFAYDGNGNVSELMGATGNAVAHYEYDSFGNQVVGSGEKANNNYYRFSTRYTDEETSLVYYGHRHYDPRIGRWTQMDPIQEAGGVALYVFGGNQATTLVDLFGLFVEPDYIKDPSETVSVVAREESRLGQTVSDQSERTRETLWQLGRVVYLPDADSPTTSGYVFTCREGWIDLGHFFTSAWGAHRLFKGGAYAFGMAVEVGQTSVLARVKYRERRKQRVTEEDLISGTSAYTPEDLISDWEGSNFGKRLWWSQPHVWNKQASAELPVTRAWEIYLRESGAVAPVAGETERILKAGVKKYWEGLKYTGPRTVTRAAAQEFKRQSDEFCKLCDPTTEMPLDGEAP